MSCSSDYSSLRSLDENFERLRNPQQTRKSQAFGGGRIVRQYMSGVGVITERHVSDDESLLFEPTHSSSVPPIVSQTSSRVSLFEDEEEEDSEISVDTIICPCDVNAIGTENRRKKNSSANIIFFVSKFKSSITQWGSSLLARNSQTQREK